MLICLSPQIVIMRVFAMIIQAAETVFFLPERQLIWLQGRRTRSCFGMAAF